MRGGGESLHGQKAGRVGAGVAAKGFFSLLHLAQVAVLLKTQEEGFSAIFKEEIVQRTVYYVSHPRILLLYNTISKI